MSGIRSSNTKPEILMRKALHRLGYRFRLDSKVGRIKPDIVLRRCKVAIFVHGCYWHQHKGCKLAYSGRERTDKWKKKFSDNKARDHRVTEQLLEQGWRIAVIWECATRETEVFSSVVEQLHSWVRLSSSQFFESSYRRI